MPKPALNQNTGVNSPVSAADKIAQILNPMGAPPSKAQLEQHTAELLNAEKEIKRQQALVDHFNEQEQKRQSEQREQITQADKKKEDAEKQLTASIMETNAKWQIQEQQKRETPVSTAVLKAKEAEAAAKRLALEQTTKALSDAKEDVVKIEAEIVEIDVEVLKTKVLITEASGRITSNDAQVNEEEILLSNAEQASIDLESELSAYINEKVAEWGWVSTNEFSSEKINQFTTQLDSTIQGQMMLAASYQKGLENAQWLVHDAESRLRSLQEDQNSTSEDIENAQNELAGASKTLQVLAEQLAVQQKSIEKNQYIYQALNAKANLLADAEKMRDAIKENVNTIKAEFEDARLDLNQLDTILDELLGALNLKKGLLNERHLKVDHLQQRLQEAEKNAKQAEESLDAMMRQVGKKTSPIMTKGADTMGSQKKAQLEENKQNMSISMTSAPSKNDSGTKKTL